MGPRGGMPPVPGFTYHLPAAAAAEFLRRGGRGMDSTPKPSIPEQQVEHYGHQSCVLGVCCIIRGFGDSVCLKTE